MRKIYFLIIAIILLSIIISVWVYPRMPEEMASHWNAQGEVDDYMPRFWGAFLMPIVTIVLFLLFVIIPCIDPLKANIDKFRKYFDGFIILMVVFLFYVHMLTLAWNLGARFDITKMILPAIGLLFIFIGFMVEKAKRNWFIGIRTPWTLSSDKVWDKTHKLGGVLFKILGVIVFFSIFSPDIAMWLVLGPAIAVALITIIYSYILYQAEQKK